MIRLHRVGFAYPDSPAPILHDVNLTIPEGELCLVIGATGSGKSTLLQIVNGLAPHFTGGHLDGTVTVGGLDTRSHPPRDLAGTVGVVGQNPAAGFVTDRVDDELAYSMEQLGIADSVMRKRVEEVIDLLALGPLRRRALSELSAGEQQRVAIGSALTAHPRVLVLDEPTSALDPTGAEEVLAAILRLVDDLGVTVLLAEHRLERVIQYADSIARVTDDGRVLHGAPVEVLADSPIAPPIIELGRLAGWSPLPRSIRDARRQATGLRQQVREQLQLAPSVAPTHAAGTSGRTALKAQRLRVRYGQVTAVADVDLSLCAGELTAVMGRNGSGKSSLLWALQGTGVRSGGTVHLVGEAGSTGYLDPAELSGPDAIRQIALVPQNPSDLLYLDSVLAECRESDTTTGAAPGTTRATLDRLSPGLSSSSHPRDLSEGQRLALVLAIQLAATPRVLLLDEPTRGLDYAAKRRLGEVLAEHTAAGAAVLLSSHDVEFVANIADRVLVLADGEIITDGPVGEVLTASPSFAPQVAKILRPLPVLVVDTVRAALGAAP
ncbi:ABC transporter ATP-binding protein [Homoserinimonas sp. OAct 916]|uniref:ABC transporter ATP-binding protein n=1 Tax=Homoserinimonas sp. OAct 916 TaxID=2211450 RepID=UPI000DBE37CD|nr:ATP-binding cassette domain-containing protein [Homoserinimonas sp. OAct 916]